MKGLGNPLILSRRSLLTLTGGGLAVWGRLYASGTDFWNKKAPTEWSAEDIQKLTTKSPWAKEVAAEWAPRESGGGSGNPDDTGYPGGSPRGGGGGYPGGGGGYPGGGGIGMPRVGIGGIPIGMGGGGRRGGGRGSRMPPSEKGVVMWQSAQPILDAIKTPLPEAFANRYVIGVSGFTLPRARRQQDEDSGDNSSTRSRPSDDDRLENLKQFATLQPKGRDLVQAGVVQLQANSSNALLFGFSREGFDISRDDKDIEFHCKLGRLLIKVKFEPKEMTYHGKLAV